MIPCITGGEGALSSVLSPAERRETGSAALRSPRPPSSLPPTVPPSPTGAQHSVISCSPWKRELVARSLCLPTPKRGIEDHLLESAPIFISSHLPALPGAERGSSLSLLRDPYNPPPRPASAGGKSETCPFYVSATCRSSILSRRLVYVHAAKFVGKGSMPLGLVYLGENCSFFIP